MAIQYPELDGVIASAPKPSVHAAIICNPALMRSLKDLTGGAFAEFVDYPKWRAAVYRRRLYAGMRLLKNTLPETYWCLTQLMTTVLIARGPGEGGSSSNRIGMAWLAPAPTWTPDSFAQALLHEFLHSWLFLEDMVRGVFPSRHVLRRSQTIFSAIRGVRRRADLAFHSAVVAYGLMVYLGRRGDSRQLSYIPQLDKCLWDLELVKQIFLPRGQAILRMLRHEVRWMTARGGAGEVRVRECENTWNAPAAT